MAKNHSDKNSHDLYGGLTKLKLEIPVELGHGVTISPVYAHIMSSVLMAFAVPENANAHHPGPWQIARGGFAHDITAQIFIPAKYVRKRLDSLEIAKRITSLFRLWLDPEISLAVVATEDFAKLKNALTNTTVATAIEVYERPHGMQVIDPIPSEEGVSWVAEHWESALDLLEQHDELRLAMEVFEIGQTIPSGGMLMVAIWGALEAIFSRSNAEVKFRVSTMIATYMYPPGEERQRFQKFLAKLYDGRSGVAHGSRAHDPKELLESYELLRRVLIRMITRREVPSKTHLEDLLFGVVQHPGNVMRDKA